jgi:hypothetical protein
VQFGSRQLLSETSLDHPNRLPRCARRPIKPARARRLADASIDPTEACTELEGIPSIGSPGR